MLLRFQVSNHRSIMSSAELSMIAVDEDRPAARAFDLLPERVLTVAGVYGPNASGKSNLLDAIAWLATAVGRSLRAWDEGIPREPFKFGDGPSSESVFEIEMAVDGVRHAYQLILDSNQVKHEVLHSYPHRSPRTLFKRDDLDIAFRRGLGTLAGTKELLTPTTLALSAAMRSDEPEVTRFARALSGIGSLGHRSRWSDRRRLWPIPYGSSSDIFADNTEKTQPALFEADEGPFGRRTALALLRFADLGIDDVRIVEEMVSDSPERAPSRRRRTQLVHRSKKQQLAFEFADESEGTRAWFMLIGPVLWALRVGQVVLFDELDASLHPRLTARLIELFQDPETNPRGAQLIFTSHDTSLLNSLNRDEVWLTEKDEVGQTQLTALAEYGGDKVRRSLNLERAYLQGRFGAVPQLDQQVVRRALGLSSEESA